MQTSGGVVRRIAKLGTRMQLGEHHLDTGELRLRLHIHRYASAVVGDFDRTVFVQGDDNMRACPGERLVHRIVDDLPQAVHETLAVGGADVHARTLAHRVQPFQHRQ